MSKELIEAVARLAAVRSGQTVSSVYAGDSRLVIQDMQAVVEEYFDLNLDAVHERATSEWLFSLDFERLKTNDNVLERRLAPDSDCLLSVDINSRGDVINVNLEIDLQEYYDEEDIDHIYRYLHITLCRNPTKRTLSLLLESLGLLR